MVFFKRRWYISKSPVILFGLCGQRCRSRCETTNEAASSSTLWANLNWDPKGKKHWPFWFLFFIFWRCIFSSSILLLELFYWQFNHLTVISSFGGFWQARATHICLDCGYIYTLQKSFDEQANPFYSIQIFFLCWLFKYKLFQVSTIIYLTESNMKIFYLNL